MTFFGRRSVLSVSRTDVCVSGDLGGASVFRRRGVFHVAAHWYRKGLHWSCGVSRGPAGLHTYLLTGPPLRRAEDHAATSRHMYVAKVGGPFSTREKTWH